MNPAFLRPCFLLGRIMAYLLIYTLFLFSGPIGNNGSTLCIQISAKQNTGQRGGTGCAGRKGFWAPIKAVSMLFLKALEGANVRVLDREDEGQHFPQLLWLVKPGTSSPCSRELEALAGYPETCGLGWVASVVNAPHSLVGQNSFWKYHSDRTIFALVTRIGSPPKSQKEFNPLILQEDGMHALILQILTEGQELCRLARLPSLPWSPPPSPTHSSGGLRAEDWELWTKHSGRRRSPPGGPDEQSPTRWGGIWVLLGSLLMGHYYVSLRAFLLSSVKAPYDLESNKWQGLILRTAMSDENKKYFLLWAPSIH